MEIGCRRGLVVIEDAAHSIGAEYHGRRVGGIADMTAFSFYATKNITSAEGGALTTNNLIRVLFRLPISDYQNVTVYPRALIQGVTLETESSFTNAECLLKTWWQGVTFKEVHVPFIKRQRGKSMGTHPRAILAAIGDIVSWWFRWIVLGRRPHRGRGRVVYANES